MNFFEIMALLNNSPTPSKKVHGAEIQSKSNNFQFGQHNTGAGYKVTDYSREFDKPGTSPAVYHMANGKHAFIKKL